MRDYRLSKKRVCTFGIFHNITTVVVTFAHCNAGSMASKTDGEFEKRLLIEA